MSDDVEVTERGEIVARCGEGEAWTEPHHAGLVWLHVEDGDNDWKVASALLSREDMAAWCRRVLREVDPDSVPTVDEAAIRADERAKVEAEVMAELRARVDWYREDAEAVSDHRLQDCAHIKREAIIEALTCIERGKHRRTP